jgi:hypothetical protein
MQIERSSFIAISLSLVFAIARSLPAFGNLPPRTQPARPKPEVWMSPPGYDNGKCFRELFENPEGWKQTRASVQVLFSTDLQLNKQFSDEELTKYFAMMKSWNLKLGMEVGAIKPWGQTGAITFAKEKPMWDRIERLGGKIHAVALDEPLVCVRNELKKDDAYAVEETAQYIALVRKSFPEVRVGDIEAYPFTSLEDHYKWIEALQDRLASLHVRKLDFYRLDVDWISFSVADKGHWREVRKLEVYCRQHGLPFSLIYWASGYPGLEKRGLADDATWYTEIMQQGYDYAMVDGHPDQYVIESWLKDAPSRSLPEDQEFTFTRSVRDFVERFVKRR